MKQWWSATLPLLALSVCLAAASHATDLISFEIQDQFKRKHRDTDLRGRVIVAVASGRKGSQFNDPWNHAIHDELEGRGADEAVAFLAFADLRGVPFFIKGLVRGRFSKNKEDWVLMDWKGRLATAYDLDPDVCNIIVFDADGRRVLTTQGTTVNPAEVSRIVETIAALPSGDGNEAQPNDR